MQSGITCTVVTINSDAAVIKGVEGGAQIGCEEEFETNDVGDVGRGVISDREHLCEDSPHSLDSSVLKDASDSEIPSMPSFSRTFMCTLMNELFQDPVVALDGETYERSAYLKQQSDKDTEKILYPNRALKVIMEDAVIAQSDSFYANWRRLHYKAKRAVSEYFLDPMSVDETTRSHDHISFPISNGFYCPITCSIMHDPVIDPDGSTFERMAVENWIRIHGNSPVTRRKLSIDELRPNHIIRKLLEEEKSIPGDLIHPDIQKWMEEPAPKSSDVEYGGTLADPSSSLLEEQVQEYRRRLARRQLLVNMAGILICILLLKFIHTASPY